MPFMGQPDTLDIILDAESFESMKVVRGDTPYGSCKGSFLFVGDTILGAKNNFSQYYTGLGIDLTGRIAVSLFPSINNNQHQGFPNLPTFWKGLKFIMDNIRDWTLICERDCCQYDFQKLSYNSNAGKKANTHLFRFLAGDGRSTCPTFIMESHR
jgi:hypothetical protein